MAMLLILGSPNDRHIQAVEKHLSQKNIPYEFFSHLEFPCAAELSCYFSKDAFEYYLSKNGRKIDLRNISAVWNRRPESPRPHTALDKAFSQYVADESWAFLENLYLLTQHHAKWLPSPHQQSRANNKPYQLYLAQQLGFNLPQTYIGNSAQDFERFFQTSGDLAVKKLHYSTVHTELNVYQKLAQRFGKLLSPRKKASQDSDDDIVNALTVPTQRISLDHFKQTKNQLAFCPIIIQDYIPKQYELRVTIVDGQVFACAIHSQEADNIHTQVDYRKNALHVRHEATTLPTEIEARCRLYLQRLGLNFGCLDFIVTPNGEYIFLELNPNGQWLWVEELSGLPISKSIVDYLSKTD